MEWEVREMHTTTHQQRHRQTERKRKIVNKIEIMTETSRAVWSTAEWLF